MKKYKTEKEFFEDLKRVKHCDLRSSQTKKEDAVKFCVDVLTCFDRLGDRLPNHDQLALTLYRLGACTTSDVSPKLAKFIDGQPIGDFGTKQGDIKLPLMIFSTILDESEKDYKSGLCTMIAGEEYSYVHEWLEAQDESIELL